MTSFTLNNSIIRSKHIMHFKKYLHMSILQGLYISTGITATNRKINYSQIQEA